MSRKLSMIRLYLNARFPVIPLFLFTSVTALGISSAITSIDYVKTAAVSIIYLLFLFHLRILDEFKDFVYDAAYHQDRPVQKGLISLTDLKIIGILNVLITFILAFIIAPHIVFIFIIITYLYTLIMFKEFFAGRWLKKRIVLYLISHEVVFIPLFLYFFSALYGRLWIVNSFSDLSILLFTIIPIILIEIGRKIPHRYDKKGRKTDDTYSYVWGEQNTIRVFSSIIIIAGLLSLEISHFNFALTVCIIFSGIVLSAMSFRNYKIIVKNNILITTLFALGLPLCLLI